MTLPEHYRVGIRLTMILLLLTGVVWGQTGDVTHVHDPQIIQHDSTFYLFSTGDGIAIRRSQDLYHWNYIGEVFQELPGWAEESVPGVSNLWAPAILKYNQRYYLYYSVSTFGSNRSCIGVTVNTTLDPFDEKYEWVDHGKVVCSQPGVSNFNTIDPHVITRSYYEVWMSFGSFWSGIKLLRLQAPDDSIGLVSAQDLHAIADRPAEDAIEAPFIYKRGDYYYLFVSFDQCCQGVESTYKIAVGRAAELTGPYYDRDGDPLAEGGGTIIKSGSTRWRGPGHNAVIDYAGSAWLVHHAYDAWNNGVPTLRIARLNWDAAGWPVVEEPITRLMHEEVQPRHWVLEQNMPNPFNTKTSITFTVPEATTIQLNIYDLQGRRLKVLANGIHPTGQHTVVWNPQRTSSGMYLCVLDTGKRKFVRRMILVK